MRPVQADNEPVAQIRLPGGPQGLRGLAKGPLFAKATSLLCDGSAASSRQAPTHLHIVRSQHVPNPRLMRMNQVILGFGSKYLPYFKQFRVLFFSVRLFLFFILFKTAKKAATTRCRRSRELRAKEQVHEKVKC